MGHNDFEGTIPTSLRNCHNMEILVLDNNKLNGSLTGNFIGQMNHLRSFYIQKNLLTGSFPADVGELKNLNELIVSDNKLSGVIPAELGN